MTPFEVAHTLARPLLPALYSHVRAMAQAEIARIGGRPELLDVGGRKSHYTIGLAADVTVTDLPRVSQMQERLHLGITDEMAAETRRRRTNVIACVYDDMTESSLPSASYDLVMAVEVLEHVEKDALFVANASRILRPHGAFLMSTPNGDFVANTNPDHKRHYRLTNLQALLMTSFSEVSVWHGVAAGRAHRLGLRAWSLRQPVFTLAGMLGNLVSALQSSRRGLRGQASGTQHIFAIARGPIKGRGESAEAGAEG